jgi:HlyD family secretion protein
MNRKRIFPIVLLTLAVFLLPACGNLNGASVRELSASGTITATSVSIAPEVSGKVAKIAVKEGDSVKAGDLLFSLEAELLQSQYDQAAAAVKVAEAAVQSAGDQLAAAQIQYDLASQVAHAGLVEYRKNAWDKPAMSVFDRPGWYFTQAEELQAAQSVLADVEKLLNQKQADLEKVLSDKANGDFVEIEKRLARAQFALRMADNALDIAKDAGDNKELKDKAQDQYDLAKTNLDNAQQEYDQALNTSAAEDVLEARAAVAAIQVQLDSAKDLLKEIQVGDNSLQVQAAAAAVKQAESAQTQAEANLTQAQANLKTLKIQLDKSEVHAPIDGSVLLQNLEVGELVSAGSTVMKVGSLDEVKLTVYIPEDQYGLVKLGQEVVAKVDSFPQKTYAGKVTFIANEAEFTPSNVQTIAGRKSTVFAVEITLPNPDHDLKSGMPADVEFIFD